MLKYLRLIIILVLIPSPVIARQQRETVWFFEDFQSISVESIQNNSIQNNEKFFVMCKVFDGFWSKTLHMNG